MPTYRIGIADNMGRQTEARSMRCLGGTPLDLARTLAVMADEGEIRALVDGGDVKTLRARKRTGGATLAATVKEHMRIADEEGDSHVFLWMERDRIWMVLGAGPWGRKLDTCRERMQWITIDDLLFHGMVRS